MKFKSIDNKRSSYDDKIRMTEPTILFGEGVKTISEYTVGNSEVCRVDLISQRFYGTPDYSEYILKYNNISNPFSITTGDVLQIPDVLAVLKNFKPINAIGEFEDAEPSIKDQFVDTKRLTIKDKKRVEYLKKKAAQKENGSKEILPPNFLKKDEKNLTINKDIEGGTIII